MRKLILIDMLSLDGFYEGPGEGWQTNEVTPLPNGVLYARYSPAN